METKMDTKTLQQEEKQVFSKIIQAYLDLMRKTDTVKDKWYFYGASNDCLMCKLMAKRKGTYVGTCAECPLGPNRDIPCGCSGNDLDVPVVDLIRAIDTNDSEIIRKVAKHRLRTMVRAVRKKGWIINSKGEVS